MQPPVWSDTTSSTPAYLPEITALTDVVKAMLLQNKTPSPAPVKAIEEICVTCGGLHPYYECLATDGNTFNASAATGTYNQGGEYILFLILFPSSHLLRHYVSFHEEFADELALLDPFPPRIDDADFDSKGDILLLEKLLNDYPSSPLPSKELHFEELKTIKSSIDDSPPLDILRGNSVTFSNPLFDANDDFTSCNDESLPEEDVLEENFKIYSNPLFEFDDEYTSSGINPLFNELLEDIKSKDSYVSNLDEPAFLVTDLSDANMDECFDLGGDIDEIDADVSTDIKDGYHDSEGDIIYLESLFINDTIPNLLPEVFLDHDPKSLNDEPKIDNLKVKASVRFTFEDRHYLSLTFIFKIFLPFHTYPMNSLLFLSSGVMNTFFDPNISLLVFSLERPALWKSHDDFSILSVLTRPQTKEFGGKISPDYDETLSARGFVNRSLSFHPLACLYMGIQYPRNLLTNVNLLA
ncbi:hypothetical protein Tco_0992366 [Tanacetum coccineum]|uniref:Reverse transcriptase domain-containing protein n=1 Tax=Tanacetum coccineum TaxID=301880 RepID=A0ABQ5F3K5_9ASTR